VDAWNLIENHFTNGVVILAGHQKKGRGRRGTEWYSTPDSSLTFSIVYTVSLPMEKLGLLSLLSGVSVVTAAKKLVDIPMQLKWPNDIMARGKKMGGILVETRKQKQEFIIVTGMGLNINEQREELPPELQNSATSLFIESGLRVQREDFLANILMQYEYYLNNLKQVIPQWNIFCSHHNDIITFHQGDQTIKGKFLGVDENGYARIEQDGIIRTYSGGWIQL